MQLEREKMPDLSCKIGAYSILLHVLTLSKIILNLSSSPENYGFKNFPPL